MNDRQAPLLVAAALALVACPTKADNYYYTHITNSGCQLYLTMQTNQVTYAESLTVKSWATGNAFFHTPGPFGSIPVDVLIDSNVISTINLPWAPYGPYYLTSSIPIRMVEGSTFTLRHTNAFEYYTETYFVSSQYRSDMWGNHWYDYYYNVYHWFTKACFNTVNLVVLPTADFRRLKLQPSKLEEIEADDDFEGLTGAPNADVWAVYGTVSHDAHNVVLSPYSMSAAIISQRKAAYPYVSLRFRSSGRYYNGGDFQPRGLRETSNPNNSIEFQNLANLTQIACRVSSNGVSSTKTYTLPSGSILDFHDYEIQASPTNAVLLLDGIVVATFTNKIPSAALNFYAETWSPSGMVMPLSLDSVTFYSSNPYMPVNQISFLGKYHSSYEFQFSTDLTNWTPFCTHSTDTNSIISFLEPVTGVAKFYRARGP